MIDLERLDFEKMGGIVTVVTQDARSGVVLMVACADKQRLAKALLALGFGRVAQDGTDGLNLVFQVSDFEAVAKIMQPRRRRRLSDQQRAGNAKRLRQRYCASAGTC